MQITKSILCLWAGCAIFAACGAFICGAMHVSTVMCDAGRYDGSDGPMNIGINLPIFGVAFIGLLAAVIALIGLLLSWLLNKQNFISWQHMASLLFLLPFALVLLVWRDANPHRSQYDLPIEIIIQHHHRTATQK